MKSKIVEYFKGKRIALLGFAKSNIAVAHFFDECEIDFEILDRDDKSSDVNKFKNSKVRYSFGENYMNEISNFDIVVRSPGVKYNNKIRESIANGVKITSEISIFFKFCKSKNIFAITGSDGKTTSSNIIYEILKKSGKNVFLGGNIGTPIISNIFKVEKNDFVVLELSSFQLFDCEIKPKVSVVTNISENHLDWHTDFEEYLGAKANVTRYQTSGDLLVLNFDDGFSEYIKNKSKSNVRFFSSKNKLSNGCFLENDKIYFAKDEKKFKIIRTDEIKITGMHNVENFMSSICACFDFVKIDDIKYVCKNFEGVKHRIEFIREINGVKYFNDSIASTPTRVIKGALSVFNENVVLIAGGYDKKLNFEKLADEICRKVKVLILMGQTADKIETCVLNSRVLRKPKILKVNSMKEAILESYRNSSQNDIVLLSSACASFGMYKNFEERGNDFKKCVLKLKNDFKEFE